MANKYTLELQADATIAQRGTESEKKALRESLKSQLDSWGSIYQENNIESLWAKLGRVDLGDQETRKEIREFVANERKLKGGNAGVEFERPFQIIETNIQLADQAAAQRDVARDAATVAAGQAERDLKMNTAPKGNGKSDRMKGIEARSQAYNEKHIAEYAKNIASVRPGLEKHQPALLKMLEEVIKDPTYERVTQLQAAIRKLDSSVLLSPTTSLAKGEPDGWFGPLTMNALQQISGSDMPLVAAPVILKSDKKPVGGSAPTDGVSTPPKASAAAPVSKTSPEGAPKSKDTYHEDVKNVNQLFAAWKTATRGADMLSSAADRESNGQLLNASLAALATGITDFHTKYVAGKTDAYALQNGEFLRSMNNAVALYLRGEGKVSNKHYRDPVSAESMLKGMLGDKIKAPAFPSQEQLLAKLDGDTKTLIRTLIDSKIKQGKSFEQALGESLGNPTIKGAWDRVISRGLEGYEKEMEAAIKGVDSKTLSQQELVSLNQLRDMYGTQGWLDLKDATKAKLIAGRNQIFAVALGIGGAALTATGLGSVAGVPMIIGASALVGGAVTTGALMVTEGKIYSGKEALTEGAINVGTFLVGGIAFRVVRSAGVIAKIGTKGAIAAEMATDYTLGVSVDQIRSTFQEVDISLAESLKSNLVWALLPLVIRGGAHVYGKRHEALAKEVPTVLKNASAKAAIGDHKGAAADLAALDTKIATVKKAEDASAGAIKKVEAGVPVFDEAAAMNQLRGLKAGEKIVWDGTCSITRRADGGLDYVDLGGKTKGNNRINKSGKDAEFVQAYFKSRSGTDSASAKPTAPASKASTPTDAPAGKTTNAPAGKTSDVPPSAAADSAASKAPDVPSAASKAADTPSAATATPDVVPGYQKFFATLEDHLATWLKKEGDSVPVPGATVTLNRGEYVVHIAGGDQAKIESFPTHPQGIANLRAFLRKNLSENPHALRDAALKSSFNHDISKIVHHEIQVGDKTLRVSGNEKDGFFLEKKTENGGFSPMSQTELAGMNPQEIDKLINWVFGSGASKKLGVPVKDPLATEAFARVKNVKIKDFLSKEALVQFKDKIPGHKAGEKIWEWTLGRYFSEIGHSLHLNWLPFTGTGLGKIEVLRTMFWSGRSSHGQFYTHSHGGFGNLLPSAWTPSAGMVAGITGVTAAEWYIDGKMENKIDGFQDYVNYANEHSSEFMKNYWNIVVLGALGTAITEGVELVGGPRVDLAKNYAYPVQDFIMDTVGLEENSLPVRGVRAIRGTIKEAATKNTVQSNNPNGEAAVPVAAPESRDRIIEEGGAQVI